MPSLSNPRWPDLSPSDRNDEDNEPHATGIFTSDVAIPSQDFSWVKAHLSDVMTSVVALHRPQQVVRHGKEAMVLLNRADLGSALEHFTFTTTAVLDDAEVTVEVTEVGVLGFGDSLHSALDDAVEELRLYTERFFANAAFYMASDRRAHAPWLLRLALTPPEAHRALVEGIEPTAGGENPAVRT